MALIAVLRSGIAREKEKISTARDRLRDLEMELLELGVELPLHESYAADQAEKQKGAA